MTKQIFQNRWLVWAIVVIVLTGATLCAVIWRANIEADSENLDNLLVLKNKQVADMIGWKTYRNEEYGFEFKYPQDWEVVENVENSGKKFSNNPAVKISYKPETIYNRNIYIFIDPPAVGLESVDRELINEISGFPVKNAVFSKFREAEESGYWFEIILWSPTHNYFISTDENPAQPAYLLAEYEQILSTFKFTN